ncbi:MAG: hypothetical protein HYY04_07455 [Chloroflexi bacterium]|nr:hypothetical protein [Chloroflexota bacterium]
MENDVKELLERHRAFWRREQVDRPLVAVRRYSPLAPIKAPLVDGARAPEDVHLRPETIDTRAIIAREERPHDRRRLIVGDTFATRSPYTRIPWVEAVLGCPIWADQYSGSIWSEPYMTDPHDTGGLPLRPDNPWYQKMREFTRVLVEVNDGSYLVAQTLMRGPIDMVRAVLGDEPMCLAIYDSPEAVRELLDVTTDVFIQALRAQLALIPPFHGGYCSPFGIWAPGTVARTQCDMSSLLSARTYAELVVPFEEKICREFDYSIIHLHSGYLHTVDALLEAEFPLAIQISLDTGSTPVTTRDVVSIAKRILERKPLLIEGHMTAADLQYALESLPPHGLYLSPHLDEALSQGTPRQGALEAGC